MADEPKRPQVIMALDEMPKELSVALKLAKMETTLDQVVIAINGLVSDSKETRERVIRLEAKFDSIDHRFDSVDAKFSGVDAKFSGVGTRFDGIDKRLDSVDKRLEEVRADAKDHRKATDRDFRISIIFTASVGLAIIGFMAKGFHWL